MTQWLTDTLVWTGVLIALVLLLRRPVARWFGPQVAYALWALPLVRLALPPLLLPASMAPVEPEAALAGAEPALMVASRIVLAQPAVSAVPWEALFLATWLAGAVILLVWRWQQYHTMRADLLADARPVGEAGAVRLVETPAVSAPVAFGVRDKVVALPPLFMAQADLAARDLAIAHELAHHRGHDLLANMLAQPLLALHWFNPLAWLGWRAMRRDQEAACDARVIAGCAAEQKARYASVIAGFARGQHPDMALAAPMACPVLGEKSIIQRLRALTRADVSRLRRTLGLGAIGLGALVALPFTASISYAQGEAPAVPQPPAPPVAVAPPSAPSAAPEAPATIRRFTLVRQDGRETMTAEGMTQAEIDAALAEARAQADEARAAGDETAAASELSASCSGQQTVVAQVDAEGRRTTTIICLRPVVGEARSAELQGLRTALAEAHKDQSMTLDLRQQVIARLQQRIDQLEARQVAYVSPAARPSLPSAPASPSAAEPPAAPLAPKDRVAPAAPDAADAVPVSYKARAARGRAVQPGEVPQIIIWRADAPVLVPAPRS